MAGHQVGAVAALEERIRKAQHRVEEAERQLGVELRAELKKELVAKERRRKVNQDEEAEPNEEHHQQVLVVARNDAVDEATVDEREHDAEDLEQDRRDGDPRPQARVGEDTAEVAINRPPLLLLRLAARREAVGLLEEERDARERSTDLVPIGATPAERRIDDADAALVDAVEDDEVVEVPVQDRSHADLGQLVRLDPHAAPRQIEVLGGVEELGGRDAVARDARRLAHGLELHVAAEIAEDHGETRGAAVGRGGLVDDRDLRLSKDRAEVLDDREALAQVHVPSFVRVVRVVRVARVVRLAHVGRHGSTVFNAGTSIVRIGCRRTRTSARPVRPS